MAGDDLHDPLGLDRSSVRAPARTISLRLISLSVLCLAFLAAFAFLRFFGDSSGGEPQAVAAIATEKPDEFGAPAQKAASEPNANKSDAAQGMIEDAAELEQKSGVKVVRSDGGSPPAAAIIEVPQGLGVALAPAPDQRLIEMSRYGLLPRIGADGARPADVYARPVVMTAATKADTPRIALVVGGLGLSRSVTEAAIANLPGAVTLAFAPYGRNLEVTVAEARAQAHEVILQLPMEPIDYPQTNPGPHTLLSTARAAENTDNLHWLLSRFTGYSGVANFLGAKFTANADAFSPILHEIAERGLIYADDGSSPQSLGVTLAADAGLRAAKADLIIDETPDGIDAALVKLEAIARGNGIAIGMASALAASLEAVGRFARMAESHGLVLIPFSAAVGKTTPTLVNSDP